MLSAFCFARSSERLHSWFTSTKLYKNNLEALSGEGHDLAHQAADYGGCHPDHGLWLCHDGPGAGGPDHSGHRVGVPHILYFVFGIRLHLPAAQATEEPEEDIWQDENGVTGPFPVKLPALGISVENPSHLSYCFIWFSD